MDFSKVNLFKTRLPPVLMIVGTPEDVQVTDGDPLTVSVYYSTMCGDTMRFFREQFLPAWNQLEGQFSAQLVPYGKSNCAEQLGLNFSAIEDCMSSEDGNVLLASHGVNTHNNMAGLAFVPSILYNGVFNESEQQETLSDFLTVLSRHVTVVQPESCSQGPLLRSTLVLLILSALLSLRTLVLRTEDCIPPISSVSKQRTVYLPSPPSANRGLYISHLLRQKTEHCISPITSVSEQKTVYLPSPPSANRGLYTSHLLRQQTEGFISPITSVSEQRAVYLPYLRQ
uniref:Thioredoxin domain-containing protein n=1 Tax=Timema tahoe TaxID=61484 RepID=A0A7R9IJD1_9NEOP|nr:unnamed protein product [Timema tahoe]